MPRIIPMLAMTIALFNISCAQNSLIPERSDIYHDKWIDLNKNGQKDIYEDSLQPVNKRIDNLIAQMSLEEKTCQLATLYGYGRVLRDPLPTPDWKNEMWKDGIGNIDEMHNGIGGSGHNNPHLATPAATAEALNMVQKWFVENTRLGIPVDFTNEGIRGACYRNSTNFPANIALGATWNKQLISNVGKVVAAESKAIGYRNIYAPIMDLCRDPRWGRVVECYGEDPYLVSECGICMASAIQQEKLASTAKHFAVYSEPKGGRDSNVRTDPHVAPREMEMLHLLPWERLVKKAHILGAMSSYNDYDGVPISGSREFLIDRLRTQWGFNGYVVSDSAAVEFLYDKHHVAPDMDHACSMFIAEGGNVRTNFTPPQDFILPLRKMIAQNEIGMDVINDRVRDVLRVKFLLGYFDHPYVSDTKQANEIIHCKEHQAVAMQAALESIVLLKNENNILPLSKEYKNILVCGPAATIKETSIDRYGSSGGEIISFLEGIKAIAKEKNITIDHTKGCDLTDSRWPESEIFPEPPGEKDSRMIAEAVTKANNADAVIVVVGDSNETIGESKSRSSLDLTGYQTDLVKAVMKTGKPVVVVLMTGGPSSINWIDRYVPGIIQAWFPGEAGGTAIAKVLFGDYNPGGKLPVTFPRTVGQIPLNFPYKPSSQAGQYQNNDNNGIGNSRVVEALYPFGYGLSYTNFAYSNLTITPEKLTAKENVTVTCDVRNTGDRTGDEIVQLYFRDVCSSVITYLLNLCGFERITLEPGQKKTVSFTITPDLLELIDREGNRVVEPGVFDIKIGQSSKNIKLKGSFEITH